MSDQTGERWWTNHDGGYFVCRHVGCSKKVNSTITDHDCCGRCRRGRDCLRTAQENYDGPGSFAHKYWEPVVTPGVCGTCREPREAH